MKKNKLNKQQIADTLREYCDRYESQNKASEALKISSATVSRILAGKWDLITGEMWRNVAAQIGANEVEWQQVDTVNFGELTELYDDAQRNSVVLAVMGDAGTSKTFTAKDFRSKRKGVYLLCCNEFWNRRLFLAELLNEMGRDNSGYTVGDMMSEAVLRLRKEDAPLLILDEADKLSDQVLYFFITLYNQLEGHCGMVLQATNHLEKRLRRGIKLNKKGYSEIWSRVGRTCIELHGVTSKDITAVCMANGVTDINTIDKIIKNSESDLRRVRRLVHAAKRKMEARKK